MVAKKLSTFLKTKYLPIILERDGNNCFYCGGSFPNKFQETFQPGKTREFDHLNNNEEDNRLENLCLAHRVCNQHKINNQSWINKARKKLRENERLAQIPEAHADTDKETPTETDTNAIFAEIVRKELSDRLLPHGDNPPVETEILYKEFLDLCAAKGYKKTGHASQNTFRRIVDMFVTSEFPYMKVKNSDKKFIIILRKDLE